MPMRLVLLPAKHQLDYLTEHVRGAVLKGRSVLLVTANQSGRRLWDYFGSVGIDTARMQVIDVVSSPLLANARADSSHLVYLGDPTGIENLMLRAQRLASKVMERPVHLIINNLNAFCLYNSSEVLEEALRRLLRDVADPDLLIDLIVEEEGGLYKDLDRFVQTHVDFRKQLGPKVVSSPPSNPPQSKKM